MKIYLGADHRGYELKEALKEFLQEKGHTVEDKGAYELNPDDDYPDFILPAARAVAKNPEDSRGIILGYSGQGEAMAANRIQGVRAAVFYGLPAQAGGSFDIVTLSREHNNANILSLGAGFVDERIAKHAVELWLTTDFSEEERHQRRIAKIDNR